MSDPVWLKPVCSAIETNYNKNIMHAESLDGLRICCLNATKSGFLALMPKLACY